MAARLSHPHFAGHPEMTDKEKAMPEETSTPIHPVLKMYSGFAPETPDEEVTEYWEVEFPTQIERPCGLLLWCPYGPLVEDFPLDGDAHEDRNAIADPEACTVFGHHCPAYYVAEPFADPEAIALECLCDECRAALDSAGSWTDNESGQPH